MNKWYNLVTLLLVIIAMIAASFKAWEEAQYYMLFAILFVVVGIYTELPPKN